MWPAHRNSGLVRDSGEEELGQVRRELEESLQEDFTRVQVGMELENQPAVIKLKAKWDMLKACNAKKSGLIEDLKQELTLEVERNSLIYEDFRLLNLEESANRKDKELQLLYIEADQLEHLLERTKVITVRCNQLHWKRKLRETRDLHSRISALSHPVHLSTLQAEHQAVHSFSLAYTQRTTVDSERFKRTNKLTELRRIKGNVESKVERLTSEIAEKALRIRVKLM